jgi:hypothetical protein
MREENKVKMGKEHREIFSQAATILGDTDRLKICATPEPPELDAALRQPRMQDFLARIRCGRGAYAKTGLICGTLRHTLLP